MDIENKQIAGSLGYYGLGFEPNYNKKVHQANMIIDTYNSMVNKIPKDKQMEYQNLMKNLSLKILNS